MATHRGFGGMGQHALYEGFAPAHGGSSRYEVLGKLASGGMGTVHLARMRGSLGFTKLVAIKTMNPRHATDPSACAMFLDEAQVTAHLRHPNIVGAVDFVAERGELMLVMDYIEGDSLRALQKASAAHTGERIPVSIAAAIARDVLHGLHAAHEARDEHGRSLGIIHRDVSPDNMIVGLDGVARVLDFGVARARCAAVADGETAVRGKVVYMAPEQLAGKYDQIDRSVDVYAVGAVLWELLTGRRLFRGGGSPRALHEMIMKQEGVLPPSLVTGCSSTAETFPTSLDMVVLAMIARDPKKRPTSALDAARAIEAAVGGKVASAQEVGAFVKRFARPRPVSATRASASAGGAGQQSKRCEFDVSTLTGFSLSRTSTFSGTHSSSISGVQRLSSKKKSSFGISTTGLYAAAALVMMIALTASVKVHSSHKATATTATASQCR